ncbi:MFS general substrate transporter [Neoconidiobolus thromboides FSU 785]|nr:MFS general substrate transporter [Neoconidiobolus thromboides FSU 785]
MLKFNTTLAQNILVGFICFCCPGMFNALNGIGGGGLEDPTVASNALVALYTTFSLVGAFAGGAINNILGTKLTMLIGCLTFALYSGSLLAYNSIENHAIGSPLVIAAGAILGIGAAMLWSAQGALMMAYPLESEKGKFISVFWVIFNIGGVLGGLISFGINFNNSSAGVTSGTYIAFMSLMIVGALIALLLLPPNKVVRSDGSPIEVPKYPSPIEEIKGVAKVFFDLKMILLIPLFLSSNWYYTYEFNTYNGLLFNIRTRSLNNALYWGTQMISATIWGKLLDNPKMTRKQRGFLALSLLGLIVSAIWGGGLAVQLNFSVENPPKPIDFSDSGYVGLVFLYIFYGLADSLVQTTSYWVMGALSNDSAVLSRYAGFYKGIQSAGAAIAWRLNAIQTPYLVELIINWTLIVAGCIAALIVATKIKESSKVEQEDKVVYQS